MSKKRNNIFTTFGTLRVNVIEALDLIDVPSKNAKKVKVNKGSVFAVLSIVDESNNVVTHYNSDIHPFVTSDAIFIGEEFLFENASSAHSLAVTFYIVSMEKEKNHNSAVSCQNCLGYTHIPLSRLEENVSVSTCVL